MSHYKQLSLEEREKIYTCHIERMSLQEIGNLLGRSKITIWRELRRNRDILGYLPDRAERLMRCRKRLNVSKIKSQLPLQQYILNGLSQKWSPEQIAGRMKLENKAFYACRDTIYTYVYAHKELIPLLPQGRAKRWQKPPPHPADNGHDLIHLKHRPKGAHNRSFYGHLEGDTIFFEHKTKQNMTVMVDRKSRYTLAVKNTSKETSVVLYGMKHALQSLPPQARQTITLDQGKEFTLPEFFKHTLGMQAFYCDKGRPWQKGTVENTNKRIRRFFPKSMNINTITQQEVENVIHIMNNTPRKVIGFKTPHELWSRFINRCTSN